LKLLSYALARCAPFAVVFLAVQFLVRLLFMLRVGDTAALSGFARLRMLLVGLSFDVSVLVYVIVPAVIYFMLLPRRWYGSRMDRVAAACAFFLAVFVTLFVAVAEWIFWDEFGVRFNFIAVDYLVYTQEVLANIWESYPVAGLIAIELAAAGLIVVLAGRFRAIRPNPPPLTAGVRFVAGICVLAVGVAIFFVRDNSDAEISLDNDVNELAKNGMFSFFAAFRGNELPYDQFFATGFHGHRPPPIRTVLEEEKALGYRFLSSDKDDITRFVPGRGPELHKNVVIIVMESMSARFMRRFGWTREEITPVLDRLAGEGLFFDRAYATGTRTVRGLEAITLSVPPTPGRSILKRPGNENLASIGFTFRDRGYDTRFIYGGHGYFDNMNYYFSHNGFSVVDRKGFDPGETTFANAWGLCDEDLYAKALSEAGDSYRAGKPFLQLLMTTSNHRPYTFPAGIPGIPASGGGRTAGVKYADYALGKYLAEAAREPWFDNTVFVVIADHTANAAGKQELDATKYHIPFLIYAPGFVEPRIFDHFASQIDVAPILLGLLQFSYVGRFYGEDLLRDYDEVPHAYVANYEKLGYLTNDRLVILRPDQTVAQYLDGRLSRAPAVDEAAVLKTIAVYAHASVWQTHMSRIPTIAAAANGPETLTRATH